MATPELWYRLGLAKEQKVLEDSKTKYHGVVIPAHILAWHRTWVVELLAGLKKPFLIDPMTYTLALDLDLISAESGMKKSWEKLLEFYAGIVQKIMSKRPLKPSDFLDDRGRATPFMHSFTQKTVELQTDLRRPKSPSQSSLTKYRKMLGEEQLDAENEPMALIAPYFHFVGESDPWFKVNMEAVRDTRERGGNRPVHAILATDLTFLHSADWSLVAHELGDVNAVVLWVSGFAERESSQSDLHAVARAVKELSREFATVHTLYGGCFSLMLAPLGLSRLSCGICYGESKAVAFKPTGGGFPIRYYFDQLKLKTGLTEARAFVSDHPAELCRCIACGKVRREVGISTSGKPTLKQIEAFFKKIDEDTAKAHFVELRCEEARLSGRLTSRELARRLRDLHAKAMALRAGDYKLKANHLERWAEVLESS